MTGIQESDVVAVIGAADALIIREVLKTGASRLELHRAAALSRGMSDAAEGLDGLTPRMRRLVDLVGVALETPPHAPLDRSMLGKAAGRAA